VKNYKISIIIENKKLQDIIVYDNKYFYPIIDDYDLKFLPSKMILQKTNDSFKKKLKENSITINKELFDELINSPTINNQLTPQTVLLLIKLFPEKEEFFI
jgi:hypothetical protein